MINGEIRECSTSVERALLVVREDNEAPFAYIGRLRDIASVSGRTALGYLDDFPVIAEPNSTPVL